MSSRRVSSFGKSYLWLLPLGGLLIAALACKAPFSSGPLTSATLNALGTVWRGALLAGAQAAGGLGLSTSTPEPSTTTPPSTLVLPTPTSAPPTIPPSTIVLSTPSPAIGGLTRPNGVPVHASPRATPPTIDGDLGDWSEFPYLINQPVYKPENWSGVNDQSATFALAWDGNALYLGVQVVDDVHVQTQHGENLFKGDSLEMLLDANLSGD